MESIDVGLDVICLEVMLCIPVFVVGLIWGPAGWVDTMGRVTAYFTTVIRVTCIDSTKIKKGFYYDLDP